MSSFGRMTRCSAFLSAATFAAMIASDAAAQCPAYPPALSRDGEQIRILGRQSGCTETHGPCQFGEEIEFTPVMDQGRPLQECDSIEWRFSVGANPVVMKSTSSAPAVFVLPDNWLVPTIGVAVTVRNDLGSATAEGSVSAQLPPCMHRDVAPGSLSASFRGALSSCANGVGKCRANEPIAFHAELLTVDAMPCDQWVVNYGDGTAPEAFRIAGLTAAADVTHYYAQGDYTATFTLERYEPFSEQAATEAASEVRLFLSVTPTGAKPSPRRRSAAP